jgi:hypothetical protein
MKKIQLILFLIVINPVFGGFIQYNNSVNKAEWLFDSGHFEEAKNGFDLAFKQVEVPKIKDIWIYVLILKKINQEDKIYKVLKNHLKDIGGMDKEITPYLEKQGIFLKHNQVKILNNIRVDTLSSNYLKTNLQLAVIDSLYSRDQHIRVEFGKNLASYKDIRRIDSLNAIKILEMFQTDELILNDMLNRKFYTLLIHMDVYDFGDIEPYLIKMLDNGKIEPWYYACAWDRSHSNAGECLKYFAYTIDNDNLKCVAYEKVLESRKKIGLSTYYSRPSFRFYVPVNKMMKIPFLSYYNNVISTSTN